MEQYIQISKLNDFLYSPKSLYFHSVYESFDDSVYHDTPQTVGRAKHKAVDTGRYSSAKRYMQGTTVYSEKYAILGKIDIYDRDKKTLIERKTLIKNIYQGYKTQLYAQYFCLLEMGYEVEKLILHSLNDNKRYKLDLPNEPDIRDFETLLEKINNYDPIQEYKNWKTEARDEQTIYKELYF